METKYEVESSNSIYNGLNCGLRCLIVRMNRSHAKDGDFLYFLSVDCHLNLIFCLFSTYLYERGGLFVFFFLSRDYFVSHHYLASVVLSVCHLSRCHISKMNSPDSDIELIDNDIIES